MSRIIVIFLILGTSLSAMSHGHHSERDPSLELEEYSRLLERIGSLEFESESQNLQMSVPFQKLFSLAANDYIEFLEGACDGCEIELSEEELLEKAKELIANGWFPANYQKAQKTIAIRYGSEFVNLGAVYGGVIGLLKVFFELVEDAALVVLKMPGLHVACEIITAVLAFASGGVATGWRSFSYAGHLNQSKLINGMKQLITSFPADKAFERIALQLGPYQLDSNSHGHLKNHWSQFVESPKEIQRIERIIRDWNVVTEKHYQKIEDLKAKRDSATRQGRINSLTNSIEKLRSQPPTFHVRRLDIEGRRHGGLKTLVLALPVWILLKLKKRNNKHTLPSLRSEGVNSKYRGTGLWMVPFINAVLDPALQGESQTFLREIDHFKAQIHVRDSRRQISNIDSLLLDKGESLGIQRNSLQELFFDINEIFDFNKTSRERRLVQKNHSGFYRQVLPKLVNGLFSNWSDMVYEENPRFKSVKKTLRLRWYVSRVSFFVNRFQDYLLAVSMGRRNKTKAFEAEQAKEYIIDIQRTILTLSQVHLNMSDQEVEDLKSQIKEDLRLLKANSFWIEKPALVPFTEPIRRMMPGIGKDKVHGLGARGRAMCIDLYM